VLPNPRLQRTPSASPPSPLSRKPLGSRESSAAGARGRDHVIVHGRGVSMDDGETRLKPVAGCQEQLRVSTRLESVGSAQRGALPNTALQRTSPAAPVPPLSAEPLGAAVEFGAEGRRPTGLPPRKAAFQSSAASTLAGPSTKSPSWRSNSGLRKRNVAAERPG
jgi:hypothetical protein